MREAHHLRRLLPVHHLVHLHLASLLRLHHLHLLLTHHGLLLHLLCAHCILHLLLLHHHGWLRGRSDCSWNHDHRLLDHGRRLHDSGCSCRDHARLLHHTASVDSMLTLHHHHPLLLLHRHLVLVHHGLLLSVGVLLCHLNGVLLLHHGLSSPSLHAILLHSGGCVHVGKIILALFKSLENIRVVFSPLNFSLEHTETTILASERILSVIVVGEEWLAVRVSYVVIFHFLTSFAT